VAGDDIRPDILVIGDSISYGWAPTVRSALLNYDVIHNPCNAKDSENGVRHIDYWLSLRPHWEAIIFNHGAWDVSFSRHVTGPDYDYYLKREAIKIKEATVHPLFILTASVPIHDATRSVGSEVAYNQIAIAIMNSINIPYVDNYSLSLTIQNLRVNADLQNDVHWTEAGSTVFGLNILNSLNSHYGIH
jgi:lysophospholipase L1-like esterase